MHYTNLLSQLRDLLTAPLSPSIFHCFSLFHWRMKSEKVLKVLMNCKGLHDANGPMHINMIASSIKIINKHNDFAVHQFKSAVVF